jgi:hypothetical protein
MRTYQLRIYAPAGPSKVLYGCKHTIDFKANDNENAYIRACNIYIDPLDHGDRIVVADDVGAEIWIVRY